MKTPICLALALATSLLTAAPITIVNPSGEINDGVDGTSVSDASVLGWDGVDAEISRGGIDFGNGAWRLTYEDSGALFQMTGHTIQTAASYSLRFDAANFSTSGGTGFIADLVLVEGVLQNGNFNADTSPDLSRTFAETPEWTNIGTAGQAIEATKTDKSVDGTRSAVLSQGASKIFAVATNHALSTGEVFEATYQWLDASNWNDGTDRVRVSLYTTANDLIDGARTDIENLTSDLSSLNNTYEIQASLFSPIPASAIGKQLFVSIDSDTNGDGTGFARVDNFTLKRGTPSTPGTASMAVDFYVDNGGSRQAVATYNVPFKALTLGDWQHYHVAVPAGTLDAEAGKTLGIQFRGANLGSTDYQSIDNVRVDWWPAAAGVPVTIVNPSGETNSGVDRESISGQFNPGTTGWDAAGADQYIENDASDGNWRLSIGDHGDLWQLTAQPVVAGDAYTLEFDAASFGSNPTYVRPYFYIEDGGNRVPLVSEIIRFRVTDTTGNWNRYRLTAQAGALDAWVGRALGIGFASVDESGGRFLSIDAVGLTRWPAGTSVPGDFNDSWETTPDQVWTGPGSWANRLLDWQVASGQVNTVGDSGSRDRRTMHRTGTSIRGNGEDVHLTVRTGLFGGTWTDGARTGFLIGAGPNLDWRASMIVHDAWGRDFGLFCGMRGNGTAVIEDYSNASTNAIGSIGATPAALPAPARIELEAVYNAPDYDLTLSVYEGNGDTLVSQATATVSSDRVLGSFALLSHRGGSNARHWFDDFGGSGHALQHEPDRQLTIVGSMYTLSRGTMRMSAQFPPFDLATTPDAHLDAWDGSAWQQIATAPIDTATRSAYNAIFTVPDWDDTVDVAYRVRLPLADTEGGSEPFTWEGTIRKDPVDKDEIVVCGLTGQRIASGNIQNEPRDWTPKHVWHPHPKPVAHIAKLQPDVIAGTGDQIYEGQPTSADNSSAFDRHYDYLGKWYFWLLQWRELGREVPLISLPDDHDVYQGNLWGEGGHTSSNQNEGGYVRPADWVKMVERTQTANLPDPDPYNPTQPAPPIDQGIGVYFTGIVYGRVGITVIEDRKFKTGPTNPPADPDDQVLLGQRQHDFLEAWAVDWGGQDLKFIVSQSPFANLHTHASNGFNFNVNDKDTNGWPVHRRNEAWEIIRKSYMFQFAGDQHLATVAHHGVDGPRDAGYSFTVPAFSNFFARCWDPFRGTLPENQRGGKTSTVSPYTGDFFLDGNGTLPSGEPNLTSTFPHHFHMLAAANPAEYYNQTRGIDPPGLHDRGAGYGITRIHKPTRRITFECWPRFADPEFPQTGSQYPDWPISISQTDNDGRTPTGFLPVVDTHWRKNPVVRIYDESTGELVNALRIRGNLFRPPVFDNGTTYRVEISYDDEPVSETRTGQTGTPAGAPTIHSFAALQPSIITGNAATLQWNVESPTTLTIEQSVGDVLTHTVDGIGYLEVNPTADTTYTLTLDGSQTADTTIRVFPTKTTWLDTHFTPAELGMPAVSGDDADPDHDGFTNEEEFQFQTDPRSAASRPVLQGSITQASGSLTVEFTSAVPLESDFCTLGVEASPDLSNWTRLPSNSYLETGRNHNPAEGTSQITIQLNDTTPGPETALFYRSFWERN